MLTDLKKLIEELDLQPHPEGGYFREIYRSNRLLTEDVFPFVYDSHRNLFTSIYYLLASDDTSKFHKLKAEEIWYFHAGSTLIIHEIDKKDGSYKKTFLGNDLKNDNVFQYCIKPGNWFGAELLNKNSFALVSCVVVPGFEFEDFQMAERSELIKQFPEHKEIIIKLTK